MLRPFNRLVRTSPRRAFPILGPAPSYRLSMRCWDPSGPQDVPCCVLISVVTIATLRASPHSDAQRQLLDDVTTSRAPLARREEPITEQKLFTVPSTLVLQHPSEGPEAGVTEVLGQVMVVEHPTNVQILQCDPVEPLDQIRRDLMKVVLTTVSDLGLDASYLEPLEFSAVASLDTPTQCPLCSGKFLLKSFGVSGVVDVLSIREGGQSVDTKINSDTLAGLRHGLDRLVQDQCYKVPTRGILGYRYRGGYACKLSGPDDLEATKTRDAEI